jgi:hypothetical protein
LDFAPTVFHLLELPIPEGWWGESIFAPIQKASAVAKTGRRLIVYPQDGGPQQIVSMNHPQNAAEKDLVTLFNNVYTNAPVSGAVSAGASHTPSP